MIVSSRSIQRVATILGLEDDAAHYAQNVETFTQVLEENFWDDSREMYDDFYID